MGDCFIESHLVFANLIGYLVDLDCVVIRCHEQLVVELVPEDLRGLRSNFECAYLSQPLQVDNSQGRVSVAAEVAGSQQAGVGKDQRTTTAQ